MQKKFAPDHWSVSIHGISIWPYFRYDYNDMIASKYRANIRFGFIDLLYLVKLLLLRFSGCQNVIFISARNDLISLLNQEPFLSDNKKLIFLREDGHGQSGNVFFIETIRFIFRQFSPYVFLSVFRDVESQLAELKLDIFQHRNNIKSAVGDYYFNKAISFFLKGKNIYFSICVIPKIERTQALHLTTEIQHGVIHSLHPCYADIPHGVFNIPLMCWGEGWREKIRSSGFRGNLVVGPSPKLKTTNSYSSNSICFFTTINNEISHRILDTLPKLTGSKVFIQKHPRDYFLYNICAFHNVKMRKGTSPIAYTVPIMHDSTLIYFCVSSEKKFIYLAYKLEHKQEIIDRLFEKYNAFYEKDYYIAFSSSELPSLIEILKSIQ